MVKASILGKCGLMYLQSFLFCSWRTLVNWLRLRKISSSTRPKYRYHVLSPPLRPQYRTVGSARRRVRFTFRRRRGGRLISAFFCKNWQSPEPAVIVYMRVCFFAESWKINKENILPLKNILVSVEKVAKGEFLTLSLSLFVEMRKNLW